MAKSTSPHNGSGVFSTLQELTAEFVFDDESQPKWGDGRVIEDPSLPSATCPGSISGASPNPVPREAGLALDRADRGGEKSLKRAVADHYLLSNTLVIGILEKIPLQNEELGMTLSVSFRTHRTWWDPIFTRLSLHDKLRNDPQNHQYC